VWELKKEFWRRMGSDEFLKKSDGMQSCCRPSKDFHGGERILWMEFLR
jgi:hypothetical protein